ncbi:MAG: hypothetical protein CMN30_21765 [Sandaracinus sp.]|nr:hypothetical protein [Sandaracinus sp.]
MRVEARASRLVLIGALMAWPLSVQAQTADGGPPPAGVPEAAEGEGGGEGEDEGAEDADGLGAPGSNAGAQTGPGSTPNGTVVNGTVPNGTTQNGTGPSGTATSTPATSTGATGATPAPTGAGATTSANSPEATGAASTTPRDAARTDAPAAPRRAAPAERTEDDAEEEDDDRFRFAYLEVAAGYSWINLGVIKQEDFVPEFQRVSGNGFALGGGAGFFISFLTLGVQAEWANHDGFDVGTVALDLGIRIPTPFIEPYIRAGVGYAWLFNLEGTDASGEPLWVDTPSIRGVAVDVGLGFDFMITELVAIGIGVDVALFNVSRDGGTVTDPAMVTLEDHGDAVGIQVSSFIQLNLHF